MRRLTLTLVMIAGLAALLPSQSKAEKPDEKTRAFMRAKLTHSQMVVEGLALENFTAIADHAEQLKLLSLDASWQVLQTMEYVQHSADFRRSAGALAKAAEGKNLDGALLAYFQLTQNCVNCHKYIRREQRR